MTKDEFRAAQCATAFAAYKAQLALAFEGAGEGARIPRMLAGIDSAAFYAGFHAGIEAIESAPPLVDCAATAPPQTYLLSFSHAQGTGRTIKTIYRKPTPKDLWQWEREIQEEDKLSAVVITGVYPLADTPISECLINEDYG